MTTEQDIEQIKEGIEKPDHPTEQETILPDYQTPDTCVFCTEKDYDSIFYQVFRVAYQHKIGKELDKQEKQTCIHHTDDWLKHSLYSAGFAWSAFRDENQDRTMGDLFEDKEWRERILTKKYEEGKGFTCAAHLYLTDCPGKKNRYSNAFTIEDDIAVQNKIIQNKLRIYYNKAIEVLRNFDDEKNNQSKKEL